MCNIDLQSCCNWRCREDALGWTSEDISTWLFMQKDLQSFYARKIVFYGPSCNTLASLTSSASTFLYVLRAMLTIVKMSELEYDSRFSKPKKKAIGTDIMVFNFLPGSALATRKEYICMRGLCCDNQHRWSPFGMRLLTYLEFLLLTKRCLLHPVSRIWFRCFALLNSTQQTRTS